MRESGLLRVYPCRGCGTEAILCNAYIAGRSRSHRAVTGHAKPACRTQLHSPIHPRHSLPQPPHHNLCCLSFHPYFAPAARPTAVPPPWGAVDRISRRLPPSNHHPDCRNRHRHIHRIPDPDSHTDPHSCATGEFRRGGFKNAVLTQHE